MTHLQVHLAGPPHAPAVVFLHGFMGRGAVWHPVAAALRATHRCVLVDLPGHGQSLGLPEAAYSMAGAAHALAATLDHLALAEAQVVGYSMGGRLALYFALHYPDRCTSLVLESASPGLRTEAERAERRRLDAERAARLTSDFPAFLDAWYQLPLFASLHRHPGLVPRLQRARRTNDPAELARALVGLSTGAQPSLWNRLPALRVATLALAGALDAKYVALAQAMQRQAPALRAEILPATGHNGHAERPQVYLEHLRRWLAQSLP